MKYLKVLILAVVATVCSIGASQAQVRVGVRLGGRPYYHHRHYYHHRDVVVVRHHRY